MPWRTGIVHLVGSRQCHATGGARIAGWAMGLCATPSRQEAVADTGERTPKEYRVSNVEGYSIPDVWSMNRRRCRRRLRCARRRPRSVEGCRRRLKCANVLAGTPPALLPPPPVRECRGARELAMVHTQRNTAITGGDRGWWVGSPDFCYHEPKLHVHET